MDESLPGFRIAITLDLCHSFGNFLDTRMLFIISFIHIVALGPRCLICSHRECSVMWLSVILAFDGRCVEFPLPFSKSW